MLLGYYLDSPLTNSWCVKLILNVILRLDLKALEALPLSAALPRYVIGPHRLVRSTPG